VPSSASALGDIAVFVVAAVPAGALVRCWAELRCESGEESIDLDAGDIDLFLVASILAEDIGTCCIERRRGDSPFPIVGGGRHVSRAIGVV